MPEIHYFWHNHRYLGCIRIYDTSVVLNFKGFNDKYGHFAGDAIIKGVADILTEGTRKHDLVGRWGGEEFIILLPDTNLQGGI